MTCESCGDKPKKCNKDFTKAVIEIDNPEQITLMRKVVIPASMGDDTTVPPVVGKYHNVLLYYEANQKSYLYSSDGIPTQLVNGVTDYEAAINLPQINSHTLIGDKTGEELGLQDKLTAGDNITIENDVISATDTTYGPATDTEIGLVKPGDGLEVDANGTMSISDIEQYAHFFDTVADMKAATNLVGGDYAKTLGYYSKDDMGGAYYKIGSTAPSGYYETLTSGLYAELILEDTMNVRQFGATGDGSTDDTAKLNTAVQSLKHLIIPDGTYMVNAVNHGVQLKSDFILELNTGATIKAIDNSASNYQVVNLENISNVEIFGGNIEGDRDTHTSEDGEWGMCISVKSCSNINIHDIKLTKAWGDGLYVNVVNGMQTQNVHVDNARRNGYSLISAENFTSINDFIENVSGTAPQAGVDLEPNLATDVFKNIKFDKLSTVNCAAVGFKVFIENINNSDKYDITLTNYHSDNEYRGVELNLFDGVKGTFRIIDGLFTKTEVNAINILNSYNDEQIIEIVRPVITDYNTTHTNNVNYSALSVKSREDDKDCGNVHITNPFFQIADTSLELAQVRVLAVQPAENQSSKKISFVDPIQMEAVHKNRYRSSIRVDSCDSLVLSDKYDVMKLDMDTSPSLNNTQIHASYDSTTFTADHNVTLDATAPIGTQVRITKGSASGDVNVKFTSGVYCYPLSQNAQPTIKLTGSIGSSIVVKKISSTVWYALESIGTLA